MGRHDQPGTTMHPLAISVILLALTASGCGRPGDRIDAPEAAVPEGQERAADVRGVVDAFWNMEQRAFNAAQARRRVRDRPFQLAVSAGQLQASQYLGVRCSNPTGLAQPALAGTAFSPDDTPSADPVVAKAEWQAARTAQRNATLNNRRMIDRAAFPFPDLCRPEEGAPLTEDEMSGRRPARPVSGPARDLHDAARRGTAAEVSEWIARSDDVDAPDSFGLTPMAWATLRNRPEIVDLLLDEGASVVAGGPKYGEHSPAWFAARWGDEAMLKRFRQFPGRAHRVRAPEWPHSVMEAALTGGTPEVVRRIFREPHTPASPAMVSAWSQSPEKTRLLREAGVASELP